MGSCSLAQVHLLGALLMSSLAAPRPLHEEGRGKGWCLTGLCRAESVPAGPAACAARPRLWCGVIEALLVFTRQAA